jgi:hypothetical protein
MVNSGELLINVVNDNKLTMLYGLAKRQAARVWDFMVPNRRCGAAGGEAGPKRSIGRSAKRGKPVRLPQATAGKEAARPDDGGRVWEDGESERHLVTGG